MIKELKDISWQVSEPTYRADSAYSYSLLARFNREGFSSIPHLFDKIESSSLTFGSVVDALLTGSSKEFKEHYLVADFPTLADNIKKIADRLFELYGGEFTSIDLIPIDTLIKILDKYDYCKKMNPVTRTTRILVANTYYKLLILSQNKIVINQDLYNKALYCREVLQNSEATKKYFEPNNEFTSIRKYYQLKFKGTHDGIPLKCMADLLYVDYENKIIIPVDLKTSSSPEYDFYKSFIHWSYDIQARLYWEVIKQNLLKDPYFKDFTLADYKFIVVNKESLCPLVWDYPYTKKMGDICVGSLGQTLLRSWRNILKDLHYYLTTSSKVPKDISLKKGNDLVSIINKNML